MTVLIEDAVVIEDQFPYQGLKRMGEWGWRGFED
jgi:hypothetical protein